MRLVVLVLLVAACTPLPVPDRHAWDPSPTEPDFDPVAPPQLARDGGADAR